VVVQEVAEAWPPAPYQQQVVRLLRVKEMLAEELTTLALVQIPMAQVVAAVLEQLEELAQLLWEGMAAMVFHLRLAGRL